MLLTVKSLIWGGGGIVLLAFGTTSEFPKVQWTAWPAQKVHTYLVMRWGGARATHFRSTRGVNSPCNIVAGKPSESHGGEWCLCWWQRLRVGVFSWGSWTLARPEISSLVLRFTLNIIFRFNSDPFLNFFLCT